MHGASVKIILSDFVIILYVPKLRLKVICQLVLELSVVFFKVVPPLTNYVHCGISVLRYTCTNSSVISKCTRSVNVTGHSLLLRPHNS